ncbi:MAG: type II and III secretion system protein family protein [Alphaproteobacteria bacterium]|nr:type II and III secretion system protein family protein [Alphaproteobacteria bacterium]MDE2013272.1 type II and III secretion system protein family protein [Alphaproteobacteria bacterium]
MMRTGMFGAALAAMAVLAPPAFVAARDGDGGARVITVETQGPGVPQRQMTLALDKAAIVQLDTDARDVLVSDPSIVDAVVRTPRRIFLLAKKVGQANAFFFDAHGHQLFSLDISVERDVRPLSSMLRANMPDAKIRVAALNDNVVLTGTVKSEQESAHAQDLAARFVGDPKKVVNMLKIDNSEQVMLRVRVAEVSRQIAKQFGIDLSSAAVAAGVPIVASTANPYGLTGTALSDLSGAQIGKVCAPTSAGTCTGGPNNLQGTVKALEQVGLMHTLAEPNLIAVSGETAKFLAGGEFPVPAGRDSQGNISVVFKQFGVGLSFTPVVLSANRISMQISTEVSELTNTGALTLAGGTTTNSSGQAVSAPSQTIPALAVRRAETTIELPSGGAFAIAGLMQHTSKQVLDAFPGLKDLPVLGALFRSRDFQNDETELVVMVSAYLVNPVSPDKIKLPTDGFVPATDPETILMGKLNETHKPVPGPQKDAANGKTGFIVQ